MNDDGLFEEEDLMSYMSDHQDDDSVLNSDISDSFDQLESDDVFECPYCHEKIESVDLVWIEPDDGLVECPICSAQFSTGISQY